MTTDFENQAGYAARSMIRLAGAPAGMREEISALLAATPSPRWSWPMTDLGFLRHVKSFTLILWVPVLGFGTDVAGSKLRDAFAREFMIGVALNTAQVDGR